jgi:hypothetical protein
MNPHWAVTNSGSGTVKPGAPRGPSGDAERWTTTHRPFAIARPPVGRSAHWGKDLLFDHVIGDRQREFGKHSAERP